MQYVGEFLSYLLLSVFAQNLLLDKALGLNTIMNAVSRKYALPKLTLVIGIYTTAGILGVCLLAPLMFNRIAYLIIAALYSLFCGAVYFMSDRVLLKISPETHDVWGEILPHALINTILIGAPLAAFAADALSWWQALGYGIGSALGFGLAVLIIQNGLDLLDHPDMPKAFRGTPAMMIYIGILSLGFCAFL